MSIADLAAWLVQKPANILAVAACNFALWATLRLTAMRAAPRANALWMPAVAWLAYAVWEWLVLVKSPEANIRVDLLLIWPLVALVTLWGWLRTAWGWWSLQRPR